MNATLILLLSFLSMTLAGCDKKTDVSKSEAAMVKEVTPEQMFTEIKKQAEAGNAHEQAQLGLIYFEGRDGIPKDDTKAAEWLQKGAVQGDAVAQEVLGLLYITGEGVPKDDAKAAEWFQKAAIQGDAVAQRNLGYLYFDGEGIVKNRLLGYAWANLAAAQGNDSAIEMRDLMEKQLSPEQIVEGQRLASNWKAGDNLVSTPTQ